MCGICGQLAWGQPTRIDLDILHKMNRSMTHRGPDDEGIFTDIIQSDHLQGAVGLAMRRLAIIDVAHGHQPIFNETEDVVVVYNGETYNFLELRSELQALGHTFKTQSDTEILVHGYEVWGDDMPAKLNGMFSFALWDRKRERLIIGRDRMGIKPLYYAMMADRLVFGSEIKAILEDSTVSREIDPLAIDDFLSHRYIPTPRSIYKSIRKLEPAHILIWEKGTIRKQCYWKYEPTDSKDHGLSYYMEKTDALLADAVKRQMISEVPLGTFLSGGVDSPTITYYAKQVKPDLMSFNILSIIPKLVDIFDEPFGDDSMIPTFFLTKMAREHMTVALSGDGGDELFGGYPTYIADRLACLYRAVPKIFTQGILEPLINRLPVSFNRISLDYKAKAFITAARRPSPLEHFGWTEVFNINIKKRLYSDSFFDSIRNRPLAENYQRAFEAAGSRKGLERFLYVDQHTHLLDEFLVKVDRLSMAHSLEVRPPFLDHRIVELAAEIPMKHKIRGGTTKYILRKLMKDRLPPYITGGAKKGFSPPMARWLATDLLSYVKRKFSPERIKDIPYLNPETPMALLQEHLTKKSNLARRLWTLLMFIEWYDRKVLKRD
jgi:asparagine synthase (glutamine-hydrolysing)